MFPWLFQHLRASDSAEPWQTIAIMAEHSEQRKKSLSMPVATLHEPERFKLLHTKLNLWLAVTVLN